MRHTVLMNFHADYVIGMLLCNNVATHDFPTFHDYKEDVSGIIEMHEEELKVLLTFIYRRETGRMIDTHSITDLEVIFIEKNEIEMTEIAFRVSFDWTASNEDDERDELIIIKDEFQF